MQEAIRAATVIMLRDIAGGAPETLMVRRGTQLSFAADRMVFPGGRVDPDDYDIASQAEWLADASAIEKDCLAARIAAIRETIEEVGLAPAVEGISENAMLQDIRARLRAEEPFSRLIAEYRLRLDPHALHPFSRWVPPAGEIARRFDTRFYIARGPDLGEAAADGSESSHCRWASAATHLAEGRMIFPTIRNLERVALFENFEQGAAFCSRYPIEIIAPKVIERDGRSWLSIPEHLGYPVTAQPIDEVERDTSLKISVKTRDPG